jgi:excisionase family DNA binding protein
MVIDKWPRRCLNTPGPGRNLLRRSDMVEPIATFALDDLEQRITLTVEEVASLLGLGRTAAYEAARRGQIPSRRLGRRVVVPVPALLEWLGAEGNV